MADSQQIRWTFTGIVEAPVDAVWDALLHVSPLLAQVDHTALTQGPAVQHISTTLGEPAVARITVDVDRSQHTLATQGEWWYRGVYTVSPHPQGSLLTYRVYNVAPTASRWLVPFVTRQTAATLPGAFSQLLQTVGERLQCAARLVAE